MINKVLKYVEKYHMIEPGDTIVAGISGGADSVCLLFVLLELRKKIPFQLKAVHVNHRIRADASEDAAYVKELCDREAVPFYLTEADVREGARARGISEEEEGRRVRYRAFEKALGGEKGRIAVAHNSNDRAETMLFHLFRGTGLAGLCGIRPVNGNIIRPLLGLSRKEIEDWLGERKICFCVDSTNGQDIYTRNKIRRHILSYAEAEVCHGAVFHMNGTAEQLIKAEEYIARQTKAAMERCVERAEGIRIKIPEFFREDEYLRGRILLACVGEAAGSGKDITSAHIRSMERLFCKEGSGEISLPYGLAVYKRYDQGMIRRKVKSEDAAAPSPEETYELTAFSKMEIPGLGIVESMVFPRKESQNIPEKTYTKWFDYDKITSSAMFRHRRKGDYLTINGRMEKKSLQDYFVNEKIPRQERDRRYVLAEGAHVIWVPGKRISEYYKITENTRNVLQVSVLDKEA